MLAQLEENPYQLLRQLRETDPVCWVPELNAWLVTRYDLAVAVLKDSGSFTVDDPRFTTARVTGPSMLSLDGPVHARHRNAFARSLRQEALRRDFIEAEISRLIEGIRPFGRAELRRDFAGPLAAAVMGDLLALNLPAGTILAWYDEIVRVVANLSGSTETGTYHTRSFGILAQNIARAVRGGKSALLADAARTLGTDEIVSNAAVLLFGGIETTEGMISNAILHISCERGQASGLRARPALLRGRASGPARDRAGRRRDYQAAGPAAERPCRPARRGVPQAAAAVRDLGGLVSRRRRRRRRVRPRRWRGSPYAGSPLDTAP
jgi:cytochrome P450